MDDVLSDEGRNEMENEHFSRFGCVLWRTMCVFNQSNSGTCSYLERFFYFRALDASFACHSSNSEFELHS
jgi:hypothetical protein